jgi:hypothetical protein
VTPACGGSPTNIGGGEVWIEIYDAPSGSYVVMSRPTNYGSEGREFESLGAHRKKIKLRVSSVAFVFQ